MTEQQITDDGAIIPWEPDVPMGAVHTGPVDSIELFPEDRWKDVPQLPKGMKEYLAENKTPFVVLDVFGRTAKQFDKPFWVAIIQVGAEKTVFSAPFSAQEDGWDRWRVVHDHLRRGATEIGPFVLQAVDTGKGNDFMRLVAVDRAWASHQVKVSKAPKPTQQAMAGK